MVELHMKKKLMMLFVLVSVILWHLNRSVQVFQAISDHMLAVISTIVSFQAAVEGLECAALKSAHQPASL